MTEDGKPLANDGQPERGTEPPTARFQVPKQSDDQAGQQGAGGHQQHPSEGPQSGGQQHYPAGPPQHPGGPQQHPGEPQQYPGGAAHPGGPPPYQGAQPQSGGDLNTWNQGQVRYQDPSWTTPREPTLAERKARERAEHQQYEQHRAAQTAAENRSRVRRRVMIGGGVTVGVVALVSTFYAGAAYSAEKNAQQATCTVEENGQVIVQPEEHCTENHARAHGGTYHHTSGGGFWLVPYAMPGGKTGHHQYRYSYSPSGSYVPGPGQRLSTPNFTKPEAGTKVQTKSGTTIQRGGFGSFGKSGGS